MEVEIKEFSSPDILDFEKFIPIDNESFSFLVEFTLGIKGKDGGDLFSIEVSTPKWFLQNYGNDDFHFCNKTLLVFSYNIEKIINEIKKIFESISGTSWEEITNKASRMGNCEFEDYKVH